MWRPRRRGTAWRSGSLGRSASNGRSEGPGSFHRHISPSPRRAVPVDSELLGNIGGPERYFEGAEEPSVSWARVTCRLMTFLLAAALSLPLGACGTTTHTSSHKQPSSASAHRRQLRH